MPIAAPSFRASLKLAGLAVLVAAAPAQARTCTVDLDKLMQIGTDITSLLGKDAHVDRAKAKGLAHKLLEQLEAGKVTLDKQDLKGVAPGGQKPSPAAIQQLLAEVQSVVKSCEQSAADGQ